MAELLSRAEWRGDMGFDIHADGHTFIIDAPEVSGGKNEGPKPTHMLAAGLMSCRAARPTGLWQHEKTPPGAGRSSDLLLHLNSNMAEAMKQDALRG